MHPASEAVVSPGILILVGCLHWMSESIVVIGQNAWTVSVLAFKLEALDSSSDS